MAKLAITVLDNELVALAQAKADLLVSIEAAQARLAEIDIQARTVERMRAQIARVESRGENDAPGASEAVLDYLRHHPRSHANTIVEAVAPLIKTQASDRNRLVYNTIMGQVKRGRIVRSSEDGKELSIAPERNGHAKDTA